MKKSWQRQIGELGQGPEANRRKRRERSTKQHTYRSETGAHTAWWEGVAPIAMLQSRRVKISQEGPLSRWITSSPNVHAISEESTTCIAVKEDRHQNIMSSVALKKGVEVIAKSR